MSEHQRLMSRARKRYTELLNDVARCLKASASSTLDPDYWARYARHHARHAERIRRTILEAKP